MKAQADGLTARGYATLACSPRGSGGTPGEWRPFGTQESEDLYDLIEWAGTAPWSNGRVGQTGISYGGIAAYKAAVAAPPHLAAVAPIAAYADVYSELVYPGGIRGVPLRWWPALTWGTSLPDQPGVDGVAALPHYLAFESEAQAHPTRDAYWRELAIDGRALDRGNVPVLGIGGWHDLFAAGMVANHVAARDQSSLLMLPWAHGDFVPGLPDFAVVDHALLAWFDHHLMRLPGAPLPSAKVTSWELPRSAGRFVELARWPASTRTQRVYLRTAGRLTTDPGTPGSRTYAVDPLDDGCACLERGVHHAPDDPYQDQRVADLGRLHFDGGLLPADVVIAGSPVAHLAVAFEAPDGNLVVRLEDVGPDGTSQVITTGWLRASHREGHERTVAPTPRRAYDYDVPLWPTHWRLRAMHLLRVTVSSGDLAMIEPNAPPGNVFVLTGSTDGSSIDIPTGTAGR
jgi:putative CocE/NonD family hydrolase